MIRAVTDTLIDHLHANTADLGAWVVQSSLSDADADPAANRLAVALYAVEEHPHLRNRPLISAPDGYRRPPLALRLSYLMTYSGAHDEAQTRLSRVIQVFHTTPILGPSAFRPELLGLVDRLTVRLKTTTPEERNQVWTALGRAMRLGLFYEVDVAPIETLEREGRGRIEDHEIGYQVVGS